MYLLKSFVTVLDLSRPDLKRQDSEEAIAIDLSISPFHLFIYFICQCDLFHVCLINSDFLTGTGAVDGDGAGGKKDDDKHDDDNSAGIPGTPKPEGTEPIKGN